MGWSAAGTLKLCRLRGRRHPMKLHVLGIDLGKTVFHLVGLDSTGKVVIRKRCSRTQLLAFTANLQVQLIGMEACSGAHFPISGLLRMWALLLRFAGLFVVALFSRPAMQAPR